MFRLFRKKDSQEHQSVDAEREYILQWMRDLPNKEYDKLMKIVEIYRDADERAKVVEFGSKKAVRELEERTTDQALEAVADLTAGFEEQ